jgi:hypothetical protein
MKNLVDAFFLKKTVTTAMMTTPSFESPFVFVTSPSVSKKETQRWQQFMNRFGIPYKTQVNSNNNSGGEQIKCDG